MYHVAVSHMYRSRMNNTVPMISTQARPHVHPLYFFYAASVLVHAVLLLIPLRPAIVSEKSEPVNSLFAVELLMPEQKADFPAREAAPSVASPGDSEKPSSLPEDGPRQKTPSDADTSGHVHEASVSLDMLHDADVHYRSYLGHVRSAINSVWHYPPQARDMGLNGTVTVRFSIMRTGRLKSLTVKKKSAHRLLDDESLRTIRAAAPFHPFPRDFTIDTLHVSASFVYEFNRE